MEGNATLALDALPRDSAAREAALTIGPRLLRFIRQRVSSDADAEDILQDVFQRLVAGYDVADPIEQLGAWLYRVARNRIIDWYRKRGGESALFTELPDEDAELADVAASVPAPDALYDRGVLWEELTRALAELPEEQRTVFIMHELEGKPFKEIARETGVPLTTLLSRKHYAVKGLRERLEDLYDEFLD